MANLQASVLIFMVLLSAIKFHGSHSLRLPNKHGEETEGIWTWIGGSNYRNQRTILNGSHKYPGSRHGASSWQDSNKTVWIFGGQGYGVRKPLDELWSFDVKIRHWNFHPFDNKPGNKQKPPPCFGCASCSYGNRAVVFGLKGTGIFIFQLEGKYWTALRNLTVSPSRRSHATYWCDSEKGMLWIFGGRTTTDKKLGDFWKFSFQEMQWNEIKPKNNKSVIPVKCSEASAWILPSGHLYMFGGSTSAAGLTSNFWIFSPKTSEWTKLGGTSSPNNCAGKFGKMGIASKNNYPGCREGAATWVDNQLWMFGGSGFDNFSNGAYAESGLLSDLWMYNTSSHQWVWIGGLSRGEGVPFFGKKGKPDVRNIPGPRESPVSFSFGKQLWLFGGAGHDVKQFDGILNDLWMYDHYEMKMTIPTEIPGDTINISFGFRVLIALTILVFGLVVSLYMCYSKECRIFRLRRRLRPVVKYKPVKVEMMEVQQPELHAPLDEPPSHGNL